MHQPDDEVPFAADAEKISAIGRGSIHAAEQRRLDLTRRDRDGGEGMSA